MSEIFNTDELKKRISEIKIKRYEYVMGVDVGDKTTHPAYCLIKRNIDDFLDSEIILCRIVKNQEDFENQVKVLAEVFNAKINRE